MKDDVPPRYAEAGMRHSRARLDYDIGSSASRYADAYSDRYAVVMGCVSSVICFLGSSRFNLPTYMDGRVGRSNLSYGGSRSSMSSQDSQGLYSSRQGMGYSGGKLSGSNMKIHLLSYINL